MNPANPPEDLRSEPQPDSNCVPACNRLTKLLGFTTAGLFVACLVLCYCVFERILHVTFAYDQTYIFDEMRAKAIQSSAPREIAGCLDYVVGYYPSGSKQQPGTMLDQIVERHRTAIEREIIAHLRLTTGQDLGHSPEPWIRKYAH